MRRLGRSSIAIAMGLALLAALALLSTPWRHEAAWRIPPRHQAYVDRALGGGAATFGMSREEYRRHTRPVVDPSRGSLCVLLASRRPDRGGSYRACFDLRDGQLLEERAFGMPLGPNRVSDRVREWLW